MRKNNKEAKRRNYRKVEIPDTCGGCVNWRINNINSMTYCKLDGNPVGSWHICDDFKSIIEEGEEEE